MMLKGDRSRGDQDAHGVEVAMEAINGATVILPDAGGAAAEAARGPVILGPEQTGEAYVVMIGAMPGIPDLACTSTPIPTRPSTSPRAS